MARRKRKKPVPRYPIPGFKNWEVYRPYDQMKTRHLLRHGLTARVPSGRLA